MTRFDKRRREVSKTRIPPKQHYIYPADELRHCADIIDLDPSIPIRTLTKMRLRFRSTFKAGGQAG